MSGSAVTPASSTPRVNSKNSRSRVAVSSCADMASAQVARLNAVDGGAKSDRAPCWRPTARMSSAGYPDTRLMWRLARMDRALAGVTPQCCAACSAVHGSTLGNLRASSA